MNCSTSPIKFTTALNAFYQDQGFTSSTEFIVLVDKDGLHNGHYQFMSGIELNCSAIAFIRSTSGGTARIVGGFQVTTLERAVKCIQPNHHYFIKVQLVDPDRFRYTPTNHLPIIFADEGAPYFTVDHVWTERDSEFAVEITEDHARQFIAQDASVIDRLPEHLRHVCANSVNKAN